MAQLPVRQMILYKHGVGFFTREGTFEGTDLSLSFQHGEINDILKSLAVFDRNGGQILGIHYQTPMDIASRLDNTGIHLSDNNSLPDLIRDLRGRLVTLRFGGQDRAASMATGRIVGLTDDDHAEARSIAVYTNDERIRIFALSDLQEIKINDEQSGQDLTYFLDTAMSEEQRRSINLRLSEGEHDLVVYYVAPSPTWRVSYRIVADLEDDGTTGKALLQGWGLFDNRIEEDLEDVMVTLVAGQPISFIYDLYASNIPQRPTVEDESRIAPGPIEYEQSFAAGAMADADQHYYEEPAAAPAMLRRMQARPGVQSAKKMSRAEMQQSAPVAAQGKESGETFQYVVTTPVSVKRGESALVPILSSEVNYERELLYNQQKLADHPVAALRFKNDTGLTLERGPVTIVENGDYKGEAIVPFSKEGNEVYLPFAVELGIAVREDVRYERSFAGLSFKDEYAVFQEYETQITTYHLDNSTDRNSIVTIEAPKSADWEIVQTPSPSAETLNTYRWRTPVPAKSQAVFTKQERQLISRSEYLQSMTHRQLQKYLSDKYLDEATYQRLQTILEAYDYIEQMHKANHKLVEERQTLYQQQEQYRNNMASLNTSGREGELRSSILDQLAQSQERIQTIGNTLSENEGKISRAETKIQQLISQLSEDKPTG